MRGVVFEYQEDLLSHKKLIGRGVAGPVCILTEKAQGLNPSSWHLLSSLPPKAKAIVSLVEMMAE